MGTNTKTVWKTGWSGLLAAAPVMALMLAACGGGSWTAAGDGSTAAGLTGDDALVRGDRTALGDSLPGLSASDRARFTVGRDTFLETEGKDDGLGPVFNGVACSECHSAGATGGAGTDLLKHRVLRIGGLVNGAYSDLANVGGPVLQSRSLREFEASYPVPPEIVPPGATFVSRRLTTPLFGAGLIEAIPDSAILAHANRRGDPDGVVGVASRITDSATGQTRIGRFGWKAHHFDLDAFAADAYLNEMGITTPALPHENLPQGLPIPAGADTAADPEDDGEDVTRFADFMRLLAPPPRANPNDPRVALGSRLFDQLRCTACHSPEMRTGPNASPALANRTVPLFSDLLLHRMGSDLADGIRQGDAAGDMFRTAPLWGVGVRPLLLHDGRASTLDDAIVRHGGEATAARERYRQLRPTDRDAVQAFLRSL